MYSGLLSATERSAWFGTASAKAFTSTASARNTEVYVAWNAAPQPGNVQYQLERSVDNRTFSQIGAAKSTAATAKNFGLTDSQLPIAATTLYYRIRKTDAKGVISYSAVRTVELAPATTSLVLYPNPAHATTRLQNGAPNATVQLLDGMGRVLTTATTDATGSVELTLPTGHTRGVYIVRQGTQFSRLVVE